jgi:hypothetical protein
MTKSSHKILAAVALTLFACAFALACIHPPLSYKGVVSERLKEAFMFHDGELAHVVLRTSLRSVGELPDSMAWVIPLPSLPKVMEEAGEGIFSELFALTLPPPPLRELAKGEAPKAAPVAAAAAPAIKVHAVTVAGDYRLQPIEILSDSAGDELNAWLKQNGFGAVPPENQRYYLKKGAVFLAVKLGALKGSNAEVKPLHLAYRAERPTLPLKFSTHSGEFDLTLYTLTPEKPAYRSLAAFHLERIYAVEVKGADLALQAPDLQKLIGNRTGWLTRFHGVHYNTPGKMVADLPDDPAFGVATPVTKTAISSEILDLAELVGVFLLISAAIAALVRSRRVKTQLPWRLRATVYALLLALPYFGVPKVMQIYSDYAKKQQVSMSVFMLQPVLDEIADKAAARKSLTGVGIDVGAPEGFSVSRNGAVSFELDPAQFGARMKIVFTPLMKDGEVKWNCEAYPEAAARRFAPARCRGSS